MSDTSASDGAQADRLALPESPTRRVRKLLSYPDLPELEKVAASSSTGSEPNVASSAAAAPSPSAGYTFSRRPTGHSRTRSGSKRSASGPLPPGKSPRDPFESIEADSRASSRQTLQSTLDDIRRLLLPFYRLFLPAERLEGLLKRVCLLSLSFLGLVHGLF
jgi:hypothetical protein